MPARYVTWRRRKKLCNHFSYSFFLSQINSHPPKSQVGFLDVLGKFTRGATCTIQFVSAFLLFPFLLRPSQPFCFVSVPPYFLDTNLSGDSEMVVREHESVSLSCRAVANPPPKVTWRREDGQEILSFNANGIYTGCFNLQRLIVLCLPRVLIAFRSR